MLGAVYKTWEATLAFKSVDEKIAQPIKIALAWTLPTMHRGFPATAIDLGIWHGQIRAHRHQTKG